MSLLAKAALFALKEVAKPTLEELGRKVGEAAGKRLARRVDPKSANDKTEKKPDAKPAESKTP